MRWTVLGGNGAWPEPGLPCSGYLLEVDPADPSFGEGVRSGSPYRVLIDPGYGTTGQLLRYVDADAVDAVFVSHGHPDHCADLNPLLRARLLTDRGAAPLPIVAPAGAVRAVLALDEPGMLDGAYELHEFTPGDGLRLGPLRADTRALPHFVTNAGVRLGDGRHSLVYTGDCGPCAALPELAAASDLLVAEAMYPDGVPERQQGHLSSAREVGRQARSAGVGTLLLTHLWPGTDPEKARRAAGEEYGGPSLVARPDRVVTLG